MAEIIGLVAEESELCPGESIPITATLDEADEFVEQWFVDGNPRDNPGDNPNVFLFRVSASTGGSTGGTRTISAQLGSSSRSVDVTVLGVTIEFEPAPTNGRFEITAEPHMPVITARAIGVSAAAATGWELEIFQPAAEDCSPNGMSLADASEVIQFPALSEIVLDFQNQLQIGHRARLTLRAQDGACDLEAARTVFFRGTNPTSDAIDAQLPHDVLRAIACQESGKRQFDAPVEGGLGNCPFFGDEGQVGVMGLQDPTLDEVWNWQSNVQAGITKFEACLTEAAQYAQQVRTSEGFNQLIVDFNARRVAEGLNPIPQITLPPFTTGDLLTNDIQQLEMDAIRGYDGWYGEDRFGFALHEFQVAVELVDGNEILRVVNIDEAVGQGEAVWERVPLVDRPINAGNPNYVEEVIALLAGCGNTSPSRHCIVAIKPDTGAAINFDSQGPDAAEIFTAQVSPNASLSANSKISWNLVQLTGYTGGFEADFPSPQEVRLRPRHPNKVRLQVQIEDGGKAICQDVLDLSVPQYFHIDFVPDFETDLEKLGLRRRPPANGPALTPGQVETNALVRQAVLDEALRFARDRYKDLNVRFTLDSPLNLVGADNYSLVVVGGVFPDPQPAGILDPLGFVSVNTADLGNNVANETVVILPGEISNRTLPWFSDPVYQAIFDELAIEDKDGNPLPGTAVDDGEFSGPLDDEITRRKNFVKAGILAAGRVMGFTIAHECGHALGLDHNSFSLRNIMSVGGLLQFSDFTGITGIDPQTGDLSLIEPVKFLDRDLRSLYSILPRL